MPLIHDQPMENRSRSIQICVVTVELKNSLLSKNLTNFPRFPLFSSLRVCKKVRFFVHFSLLLIYYFFFSKLIFRYRTDYVEVWNTFFAAHESKICRVSMISKFNATESRKMAATLWIVVSLIPLPSNRCFIRILEYFVFEDENIV